MSGRDYTDDSSGNLAAGEPTVPDFTVDSSRAGTPDPNDTQQDAQVTRRSQQDQNVTNDPDSAARRDEISNETADGDTMEDPLGVRKKEPTFASPDTTDDLLHELFQSAIMTRASIAADGINSGKAAAKSVQPSQRDKLFDGRFELLTELGAGGMGRVFKAHDTELDRTIAIKVLSLFGRDEDARVERFRQEARAAAKLNHPNIIKIHDLHTANTGERYIQFEYVEGCSLSNLLVEHKKKSIVMPVKTVLDVAIQSLAALDCMHENNIVHRDVKPGNIMLEKKTNARGLANSPHDALQEGARTARLDDYSDEEYRVKLVDFGLAKIRDEDDNTMMSITRKGQAVGTAAYMSPEQCGGERVDGCSDIYSLGCVLFEMLTGHVPFRGSDSAETMRLHQNAAIPILSLVRPKLPAVDEFERIVNKMLAKNREDRYRKAEHAKSDLKELFIGIKSGAIMEALQLESENNMTNARSLPPELHPSAPNIREGATDQVVPNALDPTLPELYDQQARKQQSDANTREDSQADPPKAERKIYADPLAPDETVQEGHGQGRKVYADPLAPDATQPSVSSQASARDAKSGASAGSANTNWDPVGGTPPVSSSSAQSRPAKKKTGQGFSEGDLFARKYEIKGHIGQGGMGVVYKALDLVLGRIVAIKFLKGKSGISQMEMSRFQQEAKAIASLNHTNIIRVHDMSVTDEGDPFFVLEYLEGHALSSELRGKTQLPLDRAFSIVTQVCDALQHAHEHGVIHRDIKPSNLMVVPQKDGTDMIKLLDFGIAKLNPIDEQTILKLTKTGELFGSPHYMSPEQCTGKEIAEQSDIYSLGCVLYELICGGPPFSGQSALDTLDKHKNASLPSVSNARKDLTVSKLIDNLLDKMMAKEPSERYQTPAEVKTAIQEISRKLEGTPFQQFKKKAFPNGLSDARGRKSAALIVAAFATLACTAYLVSKIPDTVSTKAPDLVPVPPNPWKSYDLKGQQLFDKGSYLLAEEQLLLAYEKAKSEKSQKRKLHLCTSLQELRILYTAWNKSDRVDWANSELIDLNSDEILERRQSEASWDDISRRLSKAKSADDLKQVVEMSRDLTINGNPTSAKQDTLKMLGSLRKKVELIPNSGLARDQFVLLEGFQYREGRTVPSYVEEVVSKLTAGSPDLISPEMANVLVAVGFIRTNVNPQRLEKFSEYAYEQSSLPFDRLVALIDLSRIYLQTGRRDAATKTTEKLIVEVEKQLPRDYFILICALEKRADLYVSDQSFSSAIHLYRRALSIAECVPSVARFGVRTNALRFPLSVAYVGAGKFDEAEKILLATSEDQDLSTNLLRADSLRQLGLRYLRLKKLDKAEEVFEKSVVIFKSQKSLARYYREVFQSTQADLDNLRLMRQSKGTNNANAIGQKNSKSQAD